MAKGWTWTCACQLHLYGIQVLPKCYRLPTVANFLRGPTDAGQKWGTHQLPNGDPGMTFDHGSSKVLDRGLSRIFDVKTRGDERTL
jgi:hypothetical protein